MGCEELVLIFKIVHNLIVFLSSLPTIYGIASPLYPWGRHHFLCSPLLIYTPLHFTFRSSRMDNRSRWAGILIAMIFHVSFFFSFSIYYKKYPEERCISVLE